MRWVKGLVYFGGNMRNHGHYADSGMNHIAAAQMQHAQAQRMPPNSGRGNFPGRADSFQANEEHQYMSSKPEGQWQWDRDGAKEPNVMPSHMYKEGQGNDVSRSPYQGQRPDPKLGAEKQANKDPRSQVHQVDMEVGYEDNAMPKTFEGLEQKFIQDIMKLTKELHDAEDTENVRHMERLREINTQYQDKLLAVRARQATHREEILRKESQARHQQYQQATMNNSYPNSTEPSDPHSFNMRAAAAVGPAYPGAPGNFENGGGAPGNFESYGGERPGFGGGPRGRGYESRGQYPGGRAYNTGGRHF